MEIRNNRPAIITHGFIPELSGALKPIPVIEHSALKVQGTFHMIPVSDPTGGIR